MNHQALFSSKDKSKNKSVSSAAALSVKNLPSQFDEIIFRRKRLFFLLQYAVFHKCPSKVRVKSII